MKILLVQVGDIYRFPPVLSLLKAFSDNNIDTVVVSTLPSGNIHSDFPEVAFDTLPVNYEKIGSAVEKLARMPLMGKQLWHLIARHYTSDSIIWVVTDVTLKYLGKKLLKTRYILHMLELSQELLLYKKITFLKYNAHEFGNSALAVVVPEYNRAHITAAWWGLKRVPFVLPNKPYITDRFENDSYIEDDKAREIIAGIGNRKIILYQGILDRERPIEQFIKAVDMFDGEYVFVVMSGHPDPFPLLNGRNYYYIPYIRAPKHLQVTSHAHIGVLPYVPSDDTGYSPLNSLYCAPNKTYEYSMFGVPMLGNDIPGLKYLFETEHIGSCFERFDAQSIANAIKEIENGYDSYKKCSRDYYEKCDYPKVVKDILSALQ